MALHRLAPQLFTDGVGLFITEFAQARVKGLIVAAQLAEGLGPLSRIQIGAE
ncbi:hypothetical protein D3C80_1912190 [compost metagenome]